MKEIKLTKGMVTLVDEVDFDYLNQSKWCVHRSHATFYAHRRLHGKLISMHRVILERMGFKNFEQVDHINGNKLDNRRSNLRPATESQNQWNRTKLVNNKSGYKGVHWNKDRSKWRASIRFNRHLYHLGYFTDPIEAAKAYNDAAIEYHGEFAKLNAI
jgi:hypothetical protein